MAENQVYLIKSGQNSFVEETQAIVGISGGKVGIGTTVPESFFHVAGDTQIDGDLTVKGNFTTVESTTIQVDDKNIELGVGSTTNAAADGGGITLHGATNKTFNWVDATDAWTSSEHLYLAAGKHFAADYIRALGAGGLSIGDDAGNGIFVQDGGKVGIATTNPGYDLDVNGSGNFDSLYIQGNSVLTGDGSIFGKWEDGTTPGEIYYNGGNVGVGVVDASAQLHVVGTTLLNGDVSASTIKAIDAGGLTLGDDDGNGIFVEDGGQIGINTTSPNYNLHVNGSTHVVGDFSVGSEFKISAGGAIGGTAPASDGDIIKWDDANNKWVAGANLGGGGGGGVGEVPEATINSLPSGQSIYEIEFAETYNVEPRIATQLEIDGEGSIIPYVVSGVSTSGYHLIFAQDIPNNNYRIHTTFGGRDVHWETGSSASLYYNDGDVSVQRNFTIGGNLTVNGTTTTVNTETVEIEDHNLVIAANTGYNQLDSQYPAGGAYAGILWGTGNAGAASPVSLTYQTNKGFAFEGGNVGIGTADPIYELEVKSSDPVIGVTSTTSSAPEFRLENTLKSWANYLDTAGNLVWLNRSDSNETMRITSGGNVGIGATDPANKLQVAGGNTSFNNLSTLLIDVSSSGGPKIGNYSSSADSLTIESFGDVILSADSNNNSSASIIFQEGGSEKMRIDSNGNVGIGTTNPRSKLNVAANNSGQGAILTLENSETSITADDVIGQIDFYANDASDNGTGAKLNIKGVAESEAGTLTALTFGTSNSTSDTAIERMRIDSFGNVGIGTTDPSVKLDVVGSAGMGGIKYRSGTGADVLALDIGYTLGGTGLVVKNTNGNVGIGTTNPNSKLKVVGDSAADFTALILANNYATDTAGDVVELMFQHHRSYSDPTALNDSAFVKAVKEVAWDSNENRKSALTFGTRLGNIEPAEKMRIASNGNVGIGTTDPGGKLEVRRDSASTSTNGNSSNDDTLSLVNLNDTTNNHTSIAFVGANNEVTGRICSVTDADNGRGSLDFIYGSANDGAKNLGMRITSGGNVGIGTTNPTEKLEVIGRARINTSSNLVYEDSTQGSNFALTLKNTPDLDGGSAGNNVGIAFYNYSTGNNFTRVSYISSVQEQDGARYSNLVFGTDNGTGNRNEKMRITESGRVGIGHTKPGGHLHVSGLNLSIGDVTVTDSGTEVTDGTDLDTKISNGDRIKINGEIFTVSDVQPTTLTLSDTPSTAGTYEAHTDNNALIVTSAGNVGIRTTNPGNLLHVQHNATSNAYAIIENTTVGNAGINIKNSQGDWNIVANADLRFIDNAAGAGDRMRITSSGNVGIGTTNPAGFRLNVQSNSDTVPIKGYRATDTASAYLIELNSNIGTGSDVVKFRVEADGDVISATNSYTSDERAKTEISDLNYGIDTINQLQPKQFKMLHSEEKGFKYGFIAQEIETILPDLVREDGVEDGEGGSYKALEYNSIIAVLTKAIQEQQAIIEQLQSQNAALESRISALES